MKQTKTALMLGFAIMAQVVTAQTSGSAGVNRIKFTNLGEGDNWIDYENWENRSEPGPNDAARIQNGSTARLTTETTIDAIQPGADGPGSLIIDGGKLTVTGRLKNGWNYIGYNDKGSITVQNKGSLISKHWLSVGRIGSGELIIHEGVVRVEKQFFHHREQEPRESFTSRTTLYPGGLLDVNSLVLTAGVMDLAGGTLIVRENALALIALYIEDGRMIAMGGKQEWKIQADFDDSTGYTTAVAVPEEEWEPISVEAASPSVPSSPVSNQERLFTNRGGDGRWENPANWTDDIIPKMNDVAIFNNGQTVSLTTVANVSAIRPGFEGPGELIVDGGVLAVIGVSSDDWSVIGFSRNGSLIVKNKGSVSIEKWFSIGRYGTGTLTIYEGTVRVEGEFRHYSSHHFPKEKLRDDLPSRTTLYPGGLLDVGGLALNGGVMDIAGGTLIIREFALATIEQYVAAGRIIAMGGEAGWKIQATVDTSTGWTTVIAVSDNSAPISVGMLFPKRNRTVQPAS